MTLLLNVIGPTGIHMSSDYRLTDIGTKQPIEDALGSKQLECSSDEWTAYVAFTGIAQINGQKTRDWILETLRHTSRSAGIQEAIANLVSRATNEVQRVPSDIRSIDNGGDRKSGRSTPTLSYHLVYRPTERAAPYQRP